MGRKPPTPPIETYRNGILLLPVREGAAPVTPEFIARLTQELDDEDMLRAINPNRDE